MDSKKELEKQLKAVCEAVIMALTKVAVEPMLGFITKVGAHEPALALSVLHRPPATHTRCALLPLLPPSLSYLFPHTHNRFLTSALPRSAPSPLPMPQYHLDRLRPFQLYHQASPMTPYPPWQVTAVRVAAAANPAAAKPIREQVGGCGGEVALVQAVQQYCRGGVRCRCRRT